MAKIIASAIALPPHKVPQSMAREFAASYFGKSIPEAEKLLTVFDNAHIESRNFCVPPEWFLSPKTFSEKNATYVEWATKLGFQAASNCLAQANLSPTEIDHIIFVSTTGLATPSIDARLINLLGLRNDVSRMPIWGLGCVGGACGLGYAHDYIKAYPNARVLLVAVELCGLTFHFGDFSTSNFVAVALFGDGAAAVIISGEGEGPEIIAHKSTIWPDSLDVMGWNIVDEGLQVVFAKSIPRIVTKYARDNLGGFLVQNNLTLNDIEYFLFHPGGAKVIEAYRRVLGLEECDLSLSADILREYGNMSSVTVLYILDRLLRSGFAPNKYGLLTALGPGFSSESLLLRG
jgi:alkylresorcinol/alkylpyrone synthase